MMSDFPIDLLIRQTLRSFVFDSTNMGIMTSKAEHFQARNSISQKSGVDNTFWGILRSPELMKNLYDKPSEYVHNLFENESFKEIIANTKDEQEIQKEKNRILFSFLKDVRESRPPPAMEWIAFQHYMYYVYRNFLTPAPVVTSEILPNILIKKMYALIVSLTHEDKTQFYVRIITLLREYVWVARDNFEQIKSTAEPTAFLICLLAYYSAFCSAANKLSIVLSDFDQFINDRFHINWYCLNQRIFYQYFYSSGVVQDKIHLFEELFNDKKPSVRKLMEAYKKFLDDMKLLDGHWQTQRRRITVLSDKNCKVENQWPNDWKMFGEITKIMKTNYWIIRSEETKALQDMYELDGHILALVGDTWHIADRLIASKGNCICEDCMTAEFRVNLSSGSMVSVVPQQVTVQSRHITCYICRESIALEALASHIVTKHADLNIPRADLTKTYKWHLSPPMKKNSTLKRPSAKLCKVLTETMEELAKKKESLSMTKPDLPRSENGDSISTDTLISSKLVVHPEQPEIPENLEFLSSSLKSNDSSEQQDPLDLADSGDDIEACRLVFEEYIKSRRENLIECLKKDDDGCCGTDKLLPKINGLLDKTNGLMKKERASREIDDFIPFDPNLMGRPMRRNPKKKNAMADTKMLDLILNMDKDKAGKNKENIAEPPSCIGHGCGHKCKKDDEQRKESCDHQKESKKCDCAYCEVFGNGVSNHTHKSTETRDRLRSRLNQRKEKGENHSEGETAVGNIGTSISTKPLNPQKGIPKITATLKVTHQNIQLPSAKKLPNNCTHDLSVNSCQACVPEPMKASGPKVSKGTTVPNKVTDQRNKTVVNNKQTDNLKLSERLSSLSTSSLNSLRDNGNDARNIDDLLNFIEGNKPIDKVALAQKKAAKKARQRQRKEQEKQRKEEEEEAKRKEEERIRKEKIREEERLKAIELAKKQAEDLKKNKKNKNDTYQKKQQQESKSSKKKKKSQNASQHQNEVELMEETIPAVVTIKRVVENSNSPPLVTITLKGSTPDQDKLIYTLVNGHTNDVSNNSATITATNNNSNNAKSNNKKNNKQEQEPAKQEQSKKSKNKKKKGANATNNNNQVGDLSAVTSTLANVTSKELKVTLAVDKSFRKNLPDNSAKDKLINNQSTQKPTKNNSQHKKSDTKQQQQHTQQPVPSSKPAQIKENDFDIPSLRLPPGITITKVNGPLANKNCKSTTTTTSNTNSNNNQHYPPVSKSGVIVVDTEKLIQQSLSVNANKKNKKKKKKQSVAQQQPSDSITQTSTKNAADTKPTMVTLKNPIFHALQKKMVERNDVPLMQCSEQASITKGENGMVTIRRPRCLQLPIENESPMSEFLSELKPVMEPETPPHYAAPGTMPNGKVKCRMPFNPESYIKDSSTCPDYMRNRPSDSFFSTTSSGGYYNEAQGLDTRNCADNKPPVLSPHDILWGLPGIEITKVNKNATNQETKKCEQTADVSIIPTSTNGEKFHFDKDDWPYESVFTPKDILEDDADAEEVELENFKRFCQQSVPPKHKEKVAVNVKDIILKKKYDVTYS